MTDRYEPVYGFNTKQWWIYDNETNEFIDPPEDVLNDIETIIDGLHEWETERMRLMEEVEHSICGSYYNEAVGYYDWLNDGYRYNADGLDI